MKKTYIAGKPQSTLYTGGNAGRGQNTPKKQATTTKHFTKAIPLALDRYQQSKNPLQKMLGVHASTKISPMMAKKYVRHSDPAVASAAKKIAKGYDSSIGSNT